MKYLKYSSSFLVALAFFVLLSLFCLFWVIDWVKFVVTPIVPPNKSFNYILPAGGSIRVLSNDLNALGILDHPEFLEILGYLKGYSKHLRAGEYHFEAGETPLELLKQIFDGRVLWRKMTFLEGDTFNDIFNQIESNPLIVHDLAGFPPVVVMMKLNLFQANAYPEGLFFPETYHYTAGMNDKTILLQAYGLMQKRLAYEWGRRDKGLPYSAPYQALIAASIIEKEANDFNERLQVSGIIKRRLEKKMLLQMDTTVIYAMEVSGESFHVPLRRENLKIDSFYNTYLYSGLPPTPICLPSRDSIYAALHPAGGSVLYFVARGNGSQQFSSTYSAHREAVKKYIKSEPRA